MAEAAGRQYIVKQIHRVDAKLERELAERRRQWELDAPKREAEDRARRQAEAAEAARAAAEKVKAELLSRYEEVGRLDRRRGKASWQCGNNAPSCFVIGSNRC